MWSSESLRSINSAQRIHRCASPRQPAFYEGKFDPLSEKEKEFLRLFKDLRERFYMIGIYDSGAKDSMTHELAHALFFVDDCYRKAVRKAMRGYDTTKLARQIADADYARHVIPDEIQAYIIAPSGKLGALPALTPLRQELRALFRKHSKDLFTDFEKQLWNHHCVIFQRESSNARHLLSRRRSSTALTKASGNLMKSGAAVTRTRIGSIGEKHDARGKHFCTVP